MDKWPTLCFLQPWRHNGVPGEIKRKAFWPIVILLAGLLLWLLSRIGVITSEPFVWFIPTLTLVSSLYCCWFIFVWIPQTWARFSELRKAGEEYCFECTYRTDQLPNDVEVCPECGLSREISGILWDRYNPLVKHERSSFTKEEMYPKGEPNADNR